MVKEQRHSSGRGIGRSGSFEGRGIWDNAVPGDRPLRIPIGWALGRGSFFPRGMGLVSLHCRLDTLIESPSLGVGLSRPWIADAVGRQMLISVGLAENVAWEVLWGVNRSWRKHVLARPCWLLLRSFNVLSGMCGAGGEDG
jgi:hypothetical protein